MMKKFKCLTKQNEDSLLNNYEYEELKNKIIIQSSKYNEVILFDDINQFIDFNDSLKEKIYNEVIFYDDIQKFKLDIDIKDKTFEKLYEQLDIMGFINDCIKAVFDIINCYKFKYYIFDSSDNDINILSKHVIFDFYLSNSHDSRLLYDEMIDKLSNKYDHDTLSIVDNSVYKNIQNFRLPYHRKINSNRYKICNENKKLDIIKGMIKNYRNEEIHVINLDKLHDKYSKDNMIIKTQQIEIEQHIIDEVLEKAKEHIKSFKLRIIISNKIIFNRISKGYCEICEREHENENSLYIIVYDNKFKIFCRRSELKYIEISLKNKDVNLKLNKYLILKKHLNKKINISYKYKCDNVFLEKNIIKYNKNELDEYDFRDKKVVIIHSNVKTGKTKKLKEFLDKNEDIHYIVIISFRILFSIELKEKFSNFTNYLDIKAKQYSLKKTEKIIIQLDSLHKLKIDVQPDILILDEMESVLNQFASPYIKNIKLIWEIFECLLKISKKILCMDANITQRTINLLTNIYDIDDIIYHHNTYSTLKNDKYYILFNFNIFITLLDGLIKDGNKIVIPINSLKQAKVIYKYIITKYPEKQIKIYSSETDDYVKQFDLSDVNTHWCAYDIIMYTPCITAGISFEMDHFDYLFGYFTNQSCDIYSLYQMLYRVRNLKQNKIYILFDILSTNDNVVMDKADILEEIKYSFKYLYHDALNFKINYNNNETTNIIDEKDIFFNLWLDNKIIKNKSHYYILYEFIELLIDNECKYEFIFKLQNQTKNIINVSQINIDILNDENTKIIEAPDITPDTYLSMNSAIKLTENDKITKKKHFLKILFNNFDQFTSDFLMEYNKPLRINQCINLIKVKNFTIDIKCIISNILNDNTDLANNQCIYYLTIEKHIYLKQIIDIIVLTGLNVYKIDNHDILLDTYNENIENNNEKLIELFTVLNIRINNNKVTEKDIKKIINQTWDLHLATYKKDRGCRYYIELTRSKYFNKTFPVNYNTIAICNHTL
jgi:hypothetical protein